MARETTPLLENDGPPATGNVAEETLTLVRSSTSLVLVSYLQFSLPFAGLLFVGRLGIDELGAVSLGASITNITAYGVYQGLCSGLDTLGALAYGLRRWDLATLYLKMTLMLLTIVSCPVGLGWWHSQSILRTMVSPKIAALTSQYLRVSLLSLPGHAGFEAGKRFLQSQGIFHPPIVVLCCAVPVNLALHWWFVYRLQWGFVGAPVSAALSDTILGAGLLAHATYLRPISRCSHDDDDSASSSSSPNSLLRAGAHWPRLLRLALPGSITVLAEYLTFELLTVGAGKLDATRLAAQSVLNGTVAVALQLTFAIASATTLRVATLMGQNRPRRAQLHMRIALTTAVVVGLLNLSVLLTGRYWISRQLCTSVEVQTLVVRTMPFCALLQIVYATAEWANGVMKGLQMQQTAGFLSLVCHYTIALPTSFVAGLLLKGGLVGLWLGPIIGMTMFTLLATWVIFRGGLY
ncbi:MATE efflux family protein [Aspergillus brunneoviolaceus CBS 621.78]|uniref:MATE efflux family protein n=1 Tax=Aspergillus brunneoviolaceus CBS 621.78 TaxID=1450534 RepID=A0ACD1GM53_9EURO|nr:MATE efflux family protein [Aspergillus brunneoviolaceus CBS 621.78]RAH50353.1 MATE efflux family protein [Aspergillus brunneoviolaceus CBS 621.78]